VEKNDDNSVQYLEYSAVLITDITVKVRTNVFHFNIILHNHQIQLIQH